MEAYPATPHSIWSSPTSAARASSSITASGGRRHPRLVMPRIRLIKHHCSCPHHLFSNAFRRHVWPCTAFPRRPSLPPSAYGIRRHSSVSCAARRAPARSIGDVMYDVIGLAATNQRAPRQRSKDDDEDDETTRTKTPTRRTRTQRGTKGRAQRTTQKRTMRTTQRTQWKTQRTLGAGE